jgi:hypothetical protein
MPQQLPDWLKTWARWAAAIAIVILAVVGVFNLVRFFVSPPNTMLDGEARTVATDWTTSVGRLQIEPVYPPQEDIYVGDIFAVITHSDDKLITGKMLADHAIKLWHVDMTDAVQKTYANVPVFPMTLPRPARTGDIWPQQGSDDLFAKGGKKALSLVAFPGFSVSRSRAASAGISSGQGVFGWLSGLFGISRDDEEVEQLLFPAPETYGVNAIDALVALTSFCADARTREFCKDRAVRTMLSMVVGGEIWRPEIDPKTKKPMDRYATEVELMIVKQVFLTRSIVQVHAADSTSGQVARLVAKLKEISDQPPAGGSPPAIPATPAAAPTPNPAAHPSPPQVSPPQVFPPQIGADPSVLDEQRKRLIQLQAMLDEVSQSAPGGTVTALSADGSKIALNQDYPRPIAIGFRSVHQLPLPDDDVGKK